MLAICPARVHRGRSTCGARLRYHAGRARPA